MKAGQVPHQITEHGLATVRQDTHIAGVRNLWLDFRAVEGGGLGGGAAPSLRKTHFKYTCEIVVTIIIKCPPKLIRCP